MCFVLFLCVKGNPSVVAPPLDAAGIAFADVSRASSRLVQQSKSMHWGAKRLRWVDWLRRMAPLAFVVLVIVLVIYWRFF